MLKGSRNEYVFQPQFPSAASILLTYSAVPAGLMDMPPTSVVSDTDSDPLDATESVFSVLLLGLLPPR